MTATISVSPICGYELSADTKTGRLDREYTRELIAIVSGTASEIANTTEVDICLATGCPRRFDSYGPQDLGALCIKLDVKEDKGGGGVWTITAHYSSDYGPEDPNTQANDDPLLRPAVWRYSSQRATRTLERDAQGNAYENAAGDPFQSPPELVYSTGRYTITRNEATFNSIAAMYYANRVNTATWYGFTAGQVLCESIDGEQAREGDYDFYVVTYVIHVDPKYGWQPVDVANKGYRYKKSGDYINTNVLVWLNATGGLWTSGVDPAADKYLSRYPFYTADLTALNL